jgi:hypothetical protein
MMMRVTADEQRRNVLRFLALKPDAKLGAVARGCEVTRRQASHCLDELVAEDLVSARHPARLLMFLFGPVVALLAGAERYSLTGKGLLLVAHDESGKVRSPDCPLPGSVA